jgi:hypothetical protein
MIQKSEFKNWIQKPGFKKPGSRNQIQKNEYKNPNIKTVIKNRI